MPYIQKDTQGKIVAVRNDDMPPNSIEMEEGGWLFVEHNDPQLLQFVKTLQSTNELEQSDLDFVRVVEDLVDLLVEKNYIQFTDLPDVAQKKFSTRKSLRGKLKQHLDLLDDSDEEGFL